MTSKPLYRHLIFLTFVTLAIWFAFRTLEPNIFISDDNGNYFLSTYIHTYTSLAHHHRLPLINYHQYLGNPHLGQGQSAVFYPPVYLAFFLSQVLTGSLMMGVDFLILFHLILGTLGIYLCFRYYRIQPQISFLLSLLYLSFPYILGVSRIWVVVTYLYAFLPLNWWALQKHIKSPTRITFSLLLFIKLMLVLQGYIQWVAMTLLLEIIYLLLLLRPQLHQLPALFRLRWLQSYLSIWPLTALLSAPLLLPHWHTAQISVYRATPVGISDFLRISVSISDFINAQLLQFRSPAIFQGSTFVYHIGAPLLIFMVLKSLKFPVPSSVKPLFILTLLSFVFSTELYIFAYYLPILNWFRWPFKYLPIFIFFFTFTLSLYLRRLAQTRSRRHIILATLLLSILLNFAVTFTNRGVDTAFSPNRVSSSPPNWLSKINPKAGRVLTFGIDPNAYPDPRTHATHNFATLDGYFSLGGYDATLPEITWQTTLGLSEFGFPTSDFDTSSLDHLRTWGVRYWLTPDLEALTRLQSLHPDLIPIYSGSSVQLLEDPKALPLVYWSDLSPADATFLPNGISVLPHGQFGILTFNVIIWPEYQAFADGQTIPITVINNQPTITVSPSTSTIRLIYSDTNLNLGIIISLITLFILLFLLYPVPHQLFAPKSH